MLTRNLSLALLFSLSIALVGCGSQQKKTNAAGSDSVVSDSGNNQGLGLEVNGDSDSNKAGGLKTVYFDFNSSSLRDDTRATLESNAAFLKSNPNVKVQIEGHCDERGGVQYNLALGERRAKAVREFMSSLGVDGKRMSTISFGKERPVAFGHDEEAWSKNRRANYVVISK